MTKADLIESVYERVVSSKKETGESVEEVFAIVRDAQSRGQKVKISGFGTFAVNHKGARRGRNPQTGDSIIIGSRKVLSFKPSATLRARVVHGNRAN
jgi:integration host factor subunit alpha